MPLSWNEIRSRAVVFSREWADETSEHAESKTFWDQFFQVFGVSRRRQASFEWHVKKTDGRDGFIDVFWKGRMLAEHKSRGKDLNRAHQQAVDYFPGLKDSELPRYVVVSDFARFRVHDLDNDNEIEFLLEDLAKNVSAFGFIAGYEARKISAQDPVNVEAAQLLAKLHDSLSSIGYDGHQLEVYLVRILLCLFAEDTGIFMPAGAFEEYLRSRTAVDGSDLAAKLNELYDVLDSPESKRMTNLDEQLAAFPYVNGELFSENLRTASFDRRMREILLECCQLDWATISPAVFGSLFQGIMDPVTRRELGAHYTSEENIIKVIGPLFLDDLKEELKKAGKNTAKLQRLHVKLTKHRFLDAACGCGNFLVIAYREVRLIELEILKRLYKDNDGQYTLAAGVTASLVDVHQFYGIEIEEWPAQIARVAMWLVDHQMNVLVGQTFGEAILRIPLKVSAKIVHGDALKMDWRELLGPTDAGPDWHKSTFVLGNPPFNGSKQMSKMQIESRNEVCSDIKKCGVLDFVSGWYVKAAEYIEGTEIPVALVSTNSITQGEQVGILFEYLIGQGIHINFAHRTFKWTNEARGKAAVHCVIIGFSLVDRSRKQLFDYAIVDGEPQENIVTRINPYLVNAATILLRKRRKSLCEAPEIRIGNKPIDGGWYLFKKGEKDEFIKKEPGSANYFHPWVGSDEFINAKKRWVLWLGDCQPNELRAMPHVLDLIEKVKAVRLGVGPNRKGKPPPAKKPPKSTQDLAARPTRFHVESIPTGSYLVLPEVSSERREYIPFGYLDEHIFPSNLVKISYDADLYHFGVLISSMHMAWVDSVCGRMKSDYRYSKDIVYNNYPWPIDITVDVRAKIVGAAETVLNSRLQFPDASLADLYDPRSMPDILLKAHKKLDRCVDQAYESSGGQKSWSTNATRTAFLFELYEHYTAAS